MPEYISIEKLFFEVATIINDELYKENIITNNFHDKAQQKIEKDKIGFI